MCHQRDAIDGDFTVVKCEGCGLLYLNPRPDKESLLDCYAVIQKKAALAPVPVVAAERGASGLRAWWRKLNYENPLLRLIDAGPVMDVGCGRGDLLKELRARVVEASGIEFDVDAVEACQRDGLEVEWADIELVELPRRDYRFIVLSHVLEHLTDPIQVLRALGGYLAPGGRILIVLPYARSPARRIFGNAWHGWDPPFHLIHLDEQSAVRLCARAGLRVVEARVTGHPEDFTRSFALMTGRPGRYLALRASLWPIVKTIAALGCGSYLIVSATTAAANGARQVEANFA